MRACGSLLPAKKRRFRSRARKKCFFAYKLKRHSRQDWRFMLRRHYTLALTGRSLEPTIPGKSFAPISPQPRCGAESLPSARFPDCTTRRASRLRVSNNTRESADGARGIRASLNCNRLAKSVCRYPAKSILAPVFQNQLDGSAQAFTALFYAAPLPVGAWNLWRPGNKPFAVSLNDRCEFVPHGMSIDQLHKA